MEARGDNDTIPVGNSAVEMTNVEGGMSKEESEMASSRHPEFFDIPPSTFPCC